MSLSLILSRSSEIMLSDKNKLIPIVNIYYSETNDIHFSLWIASKLAVGSTYPLGNGMSFL